MNVALRLLAQTNGDSGGGTGANGVIPSAFLTEIDCNRIWECIGQISWLEAAVFIAFGFIYVLYGWRMFRALVVINFAAIGLYAGMFFGGQLGSALWGGLMGATLMSLFCWPFMKYSIAILGALAGGILGGALWLLIGLPQPLIWCGALAGLVAGGLLVFSSYKTSIMLFTCLQGSSFIVTGGLALIGAYPNLGDHLARALDGNMFLLATFVVVPTAAGMFFQQRLIKQEQKWAMPE